MQELMIFEQNGQLYTDSREVAKAIDCRHGDLLEKIEGYIEYLADGEFRSLEYFIPDIYVDAQGKERPCYKCTKIGCDMIANKMTGKKGVIFTARYIESFERMKDIIEKGMQYNKQISFKEQVECLEVIANMLRVNDASKIMMIGQLYKSYDLPAEFLPKYEYNGSREMKSATDLLKRFDLDMNVRNFNVLLREQGYLEERTRRSTSSSDGVRKYNALTEKGLRYGENAVSPQCQRETQPMYYAESFVALFNEAVRGEVAC